MSPDPADREPFFAKYLRAADRIRRNEEHALQLSDSTLTREVGSWFRGVDRE